MKVRQRETKAEILKHNDKQCKNKEAIIQTNHIWHLFT